MRPYFAVSLKVSLCLVTSADVVALHIPLGTHVKQQGPIVVGALAMVPDT